MLHEYLNRITNKLLPIHISYYNYWTTIIEPLSGVSLQYHFYGVCAALRKKKTLFFSLLLFLIRIFNTIISSKTLNLLKAIFYLLYTWCAVRATKYRFFFQYFSLTMNWKKIHFYVQVHEPSDIISWKK